MQNVIRCFAFCHHAAFASFAIRASFFNGHQTDSKKTRTQNVQAFCGGLMNAVSRTNPVACGHVLHRGQCVSLSCVPHSMQRKTAFRIRRTDEHFGDIVRAW